MTTTTNILTFFTEFLGRHSNRNQHKAFRLI